MIPFPLCRTSPRCSPLLYCVAVPHLQNLPVNRKLYFSVATRGDERKLTCLRPARRASSLLLALKATRGFAGSTPAVPLTPFSRLLRSMPPWSAELCPWLCPGRRLTTCVCTCAAATATLFAFAGEAGRHGVWRWQQPPPRAEGEGVAVYSTAPRSVTRWRPDARGVDGRPCAARGCGACCLCRAPQALRRPCSKIRCSLEPTWHKARNFTKPET